MMEEKQQQKGPDDKAAYVDAETFAKQQKIELPKDSETNPPPDDGRLVARGFTADGEVDIRRFWKEGHPVDKHMPMKEAELGEIPKGFNPKHHDNMWAIWIAIQEVKSKARRQVPLTRDEAVQLGVTKKMLRELEAFGYINVKIVGLLKAGTNKSTGGRAIVYFTPQGRAYAREKLEKEDTNGKVQSQDPGHVGVQQHPAGGPGGASQEAAGIPSEQGPGSTSP